MFAGYASVRRVAIAVAALFVLVPMAWGQQLPQQYVKLSQDGTPIPDVNKSPFPPSPTDGSCWLASAANLLAAAGYGAGGGVAQQRAQNIYNQLTAAYGTLSGGAPDQAISYWLAWYGKNPASPDYNPALSYTDVSAEYRTLTQTDYSFLQAELYRCQYVGVQFDNPAHAVTLVGWDDALGHSIWHDSDVNNAPNGDDSYVNSFGTTWDLVVPGTQTTYLSQANGYVTLCPGLDKSPALVGNYDLAWAPSPTGPTAREAGIKAGVYGTAPGWQQQWVDPNDPNVTFEPFRINNESLPDMQKQVQLLVDFYGRSESYLNEDIRLRYLDALGQEVIATPTSAALSADQGQVLFTWLLDTQPAWEDIFFPSYIDYAFLEGEVASWNVATLCFIPEPATASLLLVLCGFLLPRRRRVL